MSRVSWAPVLAAVLAASTSSIAQPLTEGRFLEDALKNHPEIAAAEAAVTAAEGSRRQAGVIDNPEVSWEREDPSSQPRQDTWMLDWQLPFDGRKHRVAAGDAALAASTSELEATRLRLRNDMRSVFTFWHLASERARILQTHLERTQRLAAWLRVRAEQGEASGVEARRLDFEVETLRREVVLARTEASSWRSAAASWSMLVTDDATPIRPSLAPPPATAEVGDRPDLEALSQRAAEVEARARLMRRVIEPPAISVGWTEIRDGRLSFDGPVFGVSWPVPLFDRKQGDRASGEAEAVRAHFELQAARRHADARARVALGAYTDLYELISPAGDDSADAEVAVAVFAAFEAGEADLTDVLDVHRSTVDLQLARLETLNAALAAERELEAAIGRPILPGGSS